MWPCSSHVKLWFDTEFISCKNPIGFSWWNQGDATFRVHYRNTLSLLQSSLCSHETELLKISSFVLMHSQKAQYCSMIYPLFEGKNAYSCRIIAGLNVRVFHYQSHESSFIIKKESSLRSLHSARFHHLLCYFGSRCCYLLSMLTHFLSACLIHFLFLCPTFKLTHTHTLLSVVSQ